MGEYKGKTGTRVFRNSSTLIKPIIIRITTTDNPCPWFIKGPDLILHQARFWARPIQNFGFDQPGLAH